MTNAHGAHRPRQVVPPSLTPALERERRIAARMWACETTEIKDQRLIEANKESRGWTAHEYRKGNK